MRFVKGHGTGNDFVLLPDPDGQLELTPDLVSALCDRRRGLGGDGVLRVVRSAKHPEAADHAAEAEWFMDYWNADGSYAQLCGNGVRVFVRYLLSAGLAVPGAGAGAGAGQAVPVATRAGVVRAVAAGQSIAVALRRPRVYGHSTARLGDLVLPGASVDCGNPHLVCPLPAGLDLATLDLTAPPGVPAEDFPEGVNVEFVVAMPAPAGPSSPAGGDLAVRMRVYERGSAETLSCGTGACAVAAVALQDADRDTGTVAVDLPGGRLTVSLDGATCWLAGPAVLVAHGEIDPVALR